MSDNIPPTSRNVRDANQRHCHACNHIIHVSALHCPNCGAPQLNSASVHALPIATHSIVPPSVSHSLAPGHVYCRSCGCGIHQTASTCPHCGAVQGGVSGISRANDTVTPWMAITSLVLGIVVCSALFDDSAWDHDTWVGLFLFAFGGLATGIGAMKTATGRGIAITGIVLASIGLLAGLGHAMGLTPAQ